MVRDLSSIYSEKRRSYLNNPTKKQVLHGAAVRQVDGFYQESKVHQFTLSSDEHREPWGGTDRAPSPLQYLFSSLGFSLNNQILIYSFVDGVKIDSLETAVSGSFDPSGCYNIKGRNPRVTRIEVTIRLSSNSPDVVIKKLVDRASRSCPIYQTLKKATTIQKKIEIL